MSQINLPIFSANSKESLLKDVDYILNQASTVGGYIGTDGDTTFKVRSMPNGTITVQIENGLLMLSNRFREHLAYDLLPVMINSFKAIILTETE